MILYSNSRGAYGTTKGGAPSALFEIIRCLIFWGEIMHICEFRQYYESYSWTTNVF